MPPPHLALEAPLSDHLSWSTMLYNCSSKSNNNTIFLSSRRLTVQSTVSDVVYTVSCLLCGVRTTKQGRQYTQYTRLLYIILPIVYSRTRCKMFLIAQATTVVYIIAEKWMQYKATNWVIWQRRGGWCLPFLVDCDMDLVMWWRLHVNLKIGTAIVVIIYSLKVGPSSVENIPQIRAFTVQ